MLLPFKGEPVTLSDQNKKTKLSGSLKVVSALAALGVLVGCDSTGDSIGPKPAITVNGQVMKGTFVNAPINIYRASNSSGQISNIPNIDGVDDNVFTDANGNFSVTLNGDSFRNRTLVVQAGLAFCDTDHETYGKDATPGTADERRCLSNDGTYVEAEEPYFLGDFRCDDVNGCLHPNPAVGTTIAFGELVPIDFALRAVIPLLSNSSSVSSQSVNLSAISTLATNEVGRVSGGFSEDVTLAVYDKIVKVFQLDGIDLVTQEQVDVTSSSTTQADDDAWLFSAINAGMLSINSNSTAPTGTVGASLTAFNDIYQQLGGQLVYRYSNGDKNDLESVMAMAQSITANAPVGRVSDAAKASLTAKETAVADEADNNGDDLATNEETSQDIIDRIQSDIEEAKGYLFDYMDWYTQEVGPGTAADTKLSYMLNSARAGARESMSHMETMGNDFTLVLAAALNQALDSSWDGSAATLNSTDKNGTVQSATVTKTTDGYAVVGQFLNTTFDFEFSYSETTSDALPANPAEGEEDDRIYRFDFIVDSDQPKTNASNEGLTLTFEDTGATSIQVDSTFDGSHSTVVRSSYVWNDMVLAQQDIPSYDQTLGRISIDGQLVFSMEHVADTITRFNATRDGGESFNVPRVDGREFVFLQFGIYDASSPIPTKFRLTVADRGSNTGATWPVSFLYAVLNQEVEQGKIYGASGFGSFDQTYLTNTWGETACDFLPVTYTVLFSENTSDSETFNDLPVTLPNSEGTERDLVYSLSSVAQKSQLQSAIQAQKDPAKLCQVTFTANAGEDNEISTDVNFYKTISITETGSFMSRAINHFGFGDLSNTDNLFFSESPDTDDNLESRAASVSYDDCDNSGSYSGVNGGVVGRVYSCNAASVDDQSCSDYADLATVNSPDRIVGTKITRVDTDGDGKGDTFQTTPNYTSCDDGNDWEIRYTDGTIQVLPVDLSLFANP